MIIAVLVIFGLVAVAAWITAVVSAIAVVQFAAPGQKLGSLFRIDWSQFSTFKNQLGPAAVPHLARYCMATIAFLACVIAGVAISIALSADRLN